MGLDTFGLAGGAGGLDTGISQSKDRIEVFNHGRIS